MFSRSFNGFCAIVVLLAAVMLLAACGGVEGTYTSAEESQDGQDGKMSLELKGDNTAVIKMSMDDVELMSMTGTYAVEGEKVLVTMMGETQSFTRDGDTLTAMDGDERIVLTKD